MTTDTLDDAIQPTARPGLGTIFLLGSLTAFGAVSIDLYLPSLPAIGVDFHANAALVQQSMASFFVGMAVGQLLYGPLSDRFGRRPALLVGAVIYLLASIGCAAAPTIDWLIVGRFVQALGACSGQVIARAIVRDRYHHQDSARIFSLLTLVLGVAPMIAPTLGAWMVTVTGWRSIFIALAVVGGAIGLAVLARLDESRSTATADLARSESILAGFGDLLRQPRLAGYILAGALNGATLFTYVSSAPGLLIIQYGFTPRQFALVFAALAVGVIGSSQVNRILLDRFSSDRILAVASIVGVVAGLVLLALAVGGASVWLVLAALFVVLSSYGFMASNTLAGALSVDPLRAGTTSALVGAAAFGIGAAASALAGQFNDGTPRAMAAVMALALIGAAVALFTLALPVRNGS